MLFGCFTVILRECAELRQVNPTAVLMCITSWNHIFSPSETLGGGGKFYDQLCWTRWLGWQRQCAEGTSVTSHITRVGQVPDAQQTETTVNQSILFFAKSFNHFGLRFLYATAGLRHKNLSHWIVMFWHHHIAYNWVS